MLKSPQSITKQLSEAITIIGRVDFHEKWLNLIPEICQHIQSDDFNRVNGCLHTCHSLFKRYRFEFKVIHVLNLTKNIFLAINHNLLIFK